MGVEPTTNTSAMPVTNFEDWEAHRDLCTPIEDLIIETRRKTPSFSHGDIRHTGNVGKIVYHT
jgi:hypothetical protein